MQRQPIPKPGRIWLLGLLALSAVCVAALGVRVWLTGSLRYGFLGWNLFLAWLPYLAALGATALARCGRPGVIPIGIVWLLFWPNAPYIVTDAIHLRRPGAMPGWFDAGLVAIFAATGVALGLLSLLLMHRIVAARHGRAAGWLLVALAVPLGAVGIYLGRVHRFNSWDAVADPLGILRVLALDPSGPLSNAQMLALLAGMTGCLGVGYLVVRAALERVPAVSDVASRRSSTP